MIQLEADLLDVAGLLLAEQIAGPADVEVVRGELKSGAERIERLQHLEASLGLRRDFFLRQGKKRVGPHLGAPYPSAQMVKLREPEHVGAMDDQRVGGRDVETRLDDRGRQKHVVLAVVERLHDVVEHGRRHLAVSHRDAGFRHVLVEKVLGRRNVLDARAHIERLAAAIALAQ